MNFIDNSKNNETPEIVCEITKISETNFEITQVNQLPSYLKHRLPNIFNLISTSKKDNN